MYRIELRSIYLSIWSVSLALSPWNRQTTSTLMWQKSWNLHFKMKCWKFSSFNRKSAKFVGVASKHLDFHEFYGIFLFSFSIASKDAVVNWNVHERVCKNIRMSEFLEGLFSRAREREMDPHPRQIERDRALFWRIFRKRSEFCAMYKFCMNKVYAALLNAIDKFVAHMYGTTKWYVCVPEFVMARVFWCWLR